MPLFEYRCENCGHKFEELVSRPDEKVTCPECKKDVSRKLVSSFSAGGGSGSGLSSGNSGCGTGGFT